MSTSGSWAALGSLGPQLPLSTWIMVPESPHKDWWVRPDAMGWGTAWAFGPTSGAAGNPGGSMLSLASLADWLLHQPTECLTGPCGSRSCGSNWPGRDHVGVGQAMVPECGGFLSAWTLASQARVAGEVRASLADTLHSHYTSVSVTVTPRYLVRGRNILPMLAIFCATPWCSAHIIVSGQTSGLPIELQVKCNRTICILGF